jgi:multidrug efflux pump
VLVGLACKNAILIVEFAKQLRDEGQPLREATREACRLRLRPIMMTSFAFILGVVPLVVAQGAGAEMRQALGTAVFSGMLGVTLFGIFFTPVFFLVIEGLGETPFFCRPAVQRYGSAMLGGLAGLIAGGLLYMVTHISLPVALLLGVVLGVISTTLVTRLRHVPRPAYDRTACPEPTEKE